MAFADSDGDSYLTYEECIANFWIEEQRKNQVKELWSRIDPDYNYVVTEVHLRRFEHEVEDWLPTDFWDNLDANQDGLISAYEACKAAGWWTFDCEE